MAAIVSVNGLSMAVKNSTKKYKVAYVTGTRAEFGYMKRTLEEINKSPLMEMVVVATGMHTMPGFGETIKDVGQSSLRVLTIQDGNDGKSLSSMAASVGSNISQLSSIFEKEKPDILLVEGDRGEQLAATIAAAYLNIPIVHHGGGNTSGTIDNKIRWGISAFADHHFPSNSTLAGNLKKKGVPREKIYNIGGPVPDDIVLGYFQNAEECRKKYGLTKEGPVLFLVYHPNTEEHGKEEGQIDEVLKALSVLRYQTIAIGSNSDAGGHVINEQMEKFAHEYSFFKFYKNIPRFDFLGLLNVTDVLVGNTSAGFSESPSFKKPYVLIGSRQTGRFGETRHIIEVPSKDSRIVAAIHRALTDIRFRRGLKSLKNPYGKGDFYKKFPPLILEILQKGE